MNKNIKTKIEIKNLEISYSGKKILSGVNAEIPENSITCFSGASGQGKTSLLMCINRLVDEIRGASVSGSIDAVLGGKTISVLERKTDLPWLRKKAPMVFQDPDPLQTSIYKNMAFPLIISGRYDRNKSGPEIEEALRKAGLWNEVKDRLKDDARALSGGQMQRLCIARAVVMKPEILLLDEPSASLDSHNAGIIADMILELKKTCTVIAVSHNQEMIEKTADMIFEVRRAYSGEEGYSSLFPVQ